MFHDEPTEPCRAPGQATAEAGHVLLDGPHGVAVTMTPEAAMLTGQRLIAAGEEALRARDD